MHFLYDYFFCTWTLSWLATLALALALAVCTINNNKVDGVFSRTLCCSCIFCSKRSDRTDGNLLENYLPHLLTTTTRPKGRRGGWQFAAMCVSASVEIKCLSCRCGCATYIERLATTPNSIRSATRNAQLAVCLGVSIISPTLCLFAAKFRPPLSTLSLRIQLNQLTIVKSVVNLKGFKSDCSQFGRLGGNSYK